MPELDIAWELWEQVSPVLEGPLATGDHSEHSTPGVEELSTKVREDFTEQQGEGAFSGHCEVSKVRWQV